MSGGLKQQWGVGDPAQVGPDAQSQDLKAAFEKSMDAMAEHLQYTAANGERARHDPLAARSEALVPRYQAALGEVDPADAAKAKSSIDSLLADADALGKEVAAFRGETEKAAAEWQSRVAAYDAAVAQVEELQEWQHPKEAAVRSLVDAIRGFVNDRAFARAIAVLDEFLPKLQPIYEDLQKQKAAQKEYEPALATLQPRLGQVAQPSFAKLASQQSEIASSQSAMESSAQSRDFVAALAAASALGGRVDAYTAAVEELTRLKQEYEQALGQVQPKLQAAPNPSPFNKLASQQAELTGGQQQMESAAQSEEFEQALAQANDLGTKAETYTDAIEELTRLKQEYEQALVQVQPKLQAAPTPSPFNKLAPQQTELASGQQQMESAGQSEEFEQALTQANDLGTKVDAYTAAVEELTRLKQEYEQVLAQVQPKLQVAPNPSPFAKLAPQQAELASGQQQMESAAQSEEFEQALTQANDLGTKVDAYTTAIEELTRLKQEYEQALAQVQPKLQAAPNPSPFTKLAPQQAELTSGQQQMESAAQSEEFEQALTQANDLVTKVDAYKTAVEELTRIKQEYEQAVAQLQPKLQAAPNPSPFQKLSPQQGELVTGQQQMESLAQSEEFEQALAQANDLGTKAETYTAAVHELTRLKQEYEQALAQVQPKLQAAPNPSPFNKLAPQQAELASGQQQMESAAAAEEFEQALQQANDLGTKVDAYTTAVEELTKLKQEYEQAVTQLQPKLQAAPNPSPFNKLAPQQAELSGGQQQMESAAQSEEFEQALQQANELGTKVDAYTTAVEELTRLKQEYEQALAQVQPKLQAAPNPSPFAKLAPQQAELATAQQQMESAAQSEDFEQALQQANDLGTKVDAYTTAVEELTRLKQQYEQALAQVQPKLQAAPNPSPFTKLAPQQAELASGQQQMESAATDEEFEQALQQANDLGSKTDAYTAAVEELQRLKQEYEQALAHVQPKLQAAPLPSPFNKLAPMQAELTSGQQQMESAATAEEYEQALQAANDLGTKVDAYVTAVEEMERNKQAYEQALTQLQPKLQAAPSPSPFNKLAPMQSELTSGQQQMESAAQAEEFEQALQQVTDLGTKVDAYMAAVAELQRLKEEYEQTLGQIQPKLQAAPAPSPFGKLASAQTELVSGQQQMESSAQAEEFEQALQAANDLGTKVDAYTTAVEELTRLKQEYEQALAQVQPKLQAAPNPSPFNKLSPQQAELSGGQQQMESAAQSEDFEQALQQANDLGTKVDAYTTAVEELTRLKQEYEQALAQVQPKLQAAPNPSPFNKLSPQQAELSGGQQQMESAAQSEDFEQALQQANDLGTKVDAYASAIEAMERDKQGYEQALGGLQPKLQAAPSPAPFAKLAPMRDELSSSQQQMESASQGEEFAQALAAANDLSGKVDSYTSEVSTLQRAKADYERALETLRPKLDAAGATHPNQELEAAQSELATLRQQMELAAQGEEFVQALQSANELGGKVDAYAVEVAKKAKEPSAAPPPDPSVPATVSDVSPGKCPAAGGISVTITGTGFTGATAVAFGSDSQKIPATFKVDSDTQITATAPDSTRFYTSGSDLEVYVTTPAGPSRRAGDHIPVVRFGETPAAPPDPGRPATVSDVSPGKCPAAGGISVTITGTGFTGATAVAFGSDSQKIPATFKVDSDTQITATAPDSTRFYTSGSDLEVYVTTPAGPSRRAGDHIPVVRFGETPATPPDPGRPATVSDVSPGKCPATGGISVTITGTGFTGATAVAFGSDSQKIPAKFKVDSDTQITATAPDSTRFYTSGSDLEVFVTTPAGPSRRAGDHIPVVRFGETPAAPPDPGPPATVSSVSPDRCPAQGGTRVTIIGTGFTNVSSVAFGSDSQKIPARFTVDSESQITATTPDSTRFYTSGSDLEAFVTTKAGPSRRAGSTSQRSGSACAPATRPSCPR